MKILLVVSGILGMVSATRVYCDLEHTKTSGAIVSPISVLWSLDFNCNNDNNHKSEKGNLSYTLNTLLPCDGCNKWYGSDGWGYEINPKQNTDKPGAVSFWLKYQGKECNTHTEGAGTSFTIECNV
jgi:hypothetical protein